MFIKKNLVLVKSEREKERESSRSRLFSPHRVHGRENGYWMHIFFLKVSKLENKLNFKESDTNTKYLSSF